MLAAARLEMTGDFDAAPGGQLTFEQCYRAHKDDVYRWCLRYGAGRRAWAEDVTHDVFVKLLGHLPRLQRTDELAPWLYRVSANLALNRLRNEQSVLGKLSRFFVAEEHAPAPDAQHARRDAVLETLAALPARERMVLCMKVLDGKSQKDISLALDMSEGYVSKLVARAFEQVRQSGWEVDDAA